MRLGPGICAIDGCERPRKSRGWCHKHYNHWYVYGDPVASKNAQKGSGHINTKGYKIVWAPDHPNAAQAGTMPEHRFVMSGLLGRPLLDTEEVHHKNGDRLDNRPENLELWSTKQPYGQRVADKITWANEIIATYGNDPMKYEAA